MRYQKIRGHKKRQKAIEKWRLENLDIRWNLIEDYGHNYIDIIVHPWCDISLIKSGFAEPKGQTKQLIINGLLDIYDSWKLQLENYAQPYYLKIWIFEPRLSKSQVVCGIGDRIDHYNNVFFRPDNSKPFKSGNYGGLKHRLDALKWEYAYDENHYESDWVGEPEQYLTRKDFLESEKWFIGIMRKPHRTEILNNGNEYYSFRKGDIWIGG